MKRLLVLCFLPLILTGCTTTAALNATVSPTTNSVIPAVTTTAKTPITAASQPVSVANWSGSGIKTTDSFTITSSKWDIQWSSNPEMMNGTSVGMLQLYVYNINNTSLPVTIVANTSEQTSDDSYIYQHGTFYLIISGANTTWTVNVLEYK